MNKHSTAKHYCNQIQSSWTKYWNTNSQNSYSTKCMKQNKTVINANKFCSPWNTVCPTYSTSNKLHSFTTVRFSSQKLNMFYIWDITKMLWRSTREKLTNEINLIWNIENKLQNAILLEIIRSPYKHQSTPRKCKSTQKNLASRYSTLADLLVDNSVSTNYHPKRHLFNKNKLNDSLYRASSWLDVEQDNLFNRQYC